MNEIRFDKYRLLERISHGGMAEVFRAKTFGAAGFERDVAIKLLLPSVAMDREFITMLIDEAKIAGQLSHANIAQIFDLGMAEGRYYIVQEFVNGKDLRAIIRRCRQVKEPLSVAQAVHIMIKVCEGLDYAHNKKDPNGRSLNVVHRDVSPQNVLVSIDGEVKLIDFGIAKAEGRATRTLAGLVKGKFAYMSPEQIRGLPVDRRSDVFACGIVLHELLTAKPLFLRKSEFETLKRARSGDIPPPSMLNPAVPEELDEITLKALARHVDDRFASAKEMREALWDFVKESKEFYSQDQLADWMRATFGVAQEENTQTAVTTERDKKVKRFDDYAGSEAKRLDEPAETFSEGTDSEFSSKPRDRYAADGEGSMTMPDLPPAANKARSEKIKRMQPRPRGGEPALLPPAPDTGRPRTSPSPFALANQRIGDDRPPMDRVPYTVPMSNPPAPAPLGKSEPARTEERTQNPTNSFSHERTIPFYGRTSRHSMRALTDNEPDAEPTRGKSVSQRLAAELSGVRMPPTKARLSLLIVAALLLLLVAGAASLTLWSINRTDSDSGDTTENKLLPDNESSEEQ